MPNILKVQENNPQVTCHLIPVSITHSGTAPVSTYFESTIREKDLLQASFRGYPLLGSKVEIPKGFKGVNFQADRKSDQKYQSKQEFKEVTYWKWDQIPHSGDPFPRSFQWLDISSAIHSRDPTTSKVPTNLVIITPVTIPLPPLVNFREVGFRIMKNENIPLNNQDELMKELYDFIQEETEKFEDQESDIGEEERKETCSRFSTILRSLNHQKKLADENEECSELSFWQMYHKIIHSGFLTEPLVTLEHSFSLVVKEMVELRDQSIQEVTSRQSHEMEDMLVKVSDGVASVDDVNKLSITHFAELDDEKKKWERSLTDLKEAQKEEVSGWIRTVYQDLNEGKTEEIVSKIRRRTESSLMKNIDYDLQSIDTLSSEDLSSNLMDESFTINLGAQLKTTHNLRLTSGNILDVCRNKFGISISLPTPQRIQTAMSMYSNHLSGLVLLVDNRVNSYSGVKKEFSGICEQSTDFHFPPLEQQLEAIRTDLQNRSESSNNLSLKVGDFYTTKHSNLSEVHVVFHLVTDESIHSSDISSRHPLVLGLRNILRTAHLSEVSTISLPLLLTHEMSENMTLAWCLRRAELVFKCMKGFMIEMASLTPTSDGNRTVKFVLPEGIQEQLFFSLASMLPSIFRLSNPLFLKSSSSE